MEPLTDCLYSVARGSMIGGLLGAGFHVVGGGYVQSQGRTTLTNKHIIGEAGRAALRLGFVFGMYTSVRCALLRATCGSDAISCGTAGACAVVVPTAADPSRLSFLRGYYGEMFATLLPQAGAPGRHVRGMKAMPASLPLVLASSAMSGALVFGLPDMLAHRLLGIRW